MVSTIDWIKAEAKEWVEKDFARIQNVEAFAQDAAEDLSDYLDDAELTQLLVERPLYGARTVGKGDSVYDALKACAKEVAAWAIKEHYDRMASLREVVGHKLGVGLSEQDERFWGMALREAQRIKGDWPQADDIATAIEKILEDSRLLKAGR